mgnify:CR=1 FL=1
MNATAELTRARALADGGVRAGGAAFADGRINDAGAVWGCRSGEDFLFVRLRPEASRIDINLAEPELLAALFHADAPNDVAPSAYNEDDPPGGLPASPLAPRPEATGFRWAE